MAVNPDLIRSKLAFILEEVAALDQLIQNLPAGEFRADLWRVRGVKFSLHMAIEAMIDIAYHVCAKAFSRAPQDADSEKTRGRRRCQRPFHHRSAWRRSGTQARPRAARTLSAGL